MPKSAADGIIQEANGSVSKLEQLLSLEHGALGDSSVRLDIAAPQGLRMPSGNELGANIEYNFSHVIGKNFFCFYDDA